MRAGAGIRKETMWASPHGINLDPTLNLSGRRTKTWGRFLALATNTIANELGVISAPIFENMRRDTRFFRKSSYAHRTRLRT